MEAYIDLANKSAETTHEFYEDAKKFIIAVINTSKSYAGIVDGKNRIIKSAFVIGAYGVEISQINNPFYIVDGEEKTKVDVFNFYLYYRKHYKSIFGIDKTYKQYLIIDHFYKEIGNTRSIDLFRCESLEDNDPNCFDPADLPVIRDYLDTINGVLEGAKAYLTL